MLELELIVQPSVDPALGPSVDAWLMREVAGRMRRGGVLRVYGIAGEVVSLGRYHFAPAERPSGPALARRLTGGRAWPHGEGFVGVSLILPHRSALVSDDPFALAPHQVLNRCARPILDGLRRAGIDAFYPGRDLITVGGKVIAALSFEVDARGTLLFEAVLSAARGFDSLTSLLDAVDPDGQVVAPVWSREETTSLDREGRGGLGPGDVAELSSAALREKLQTVVCPVELADEDWRRIRALAADDDVAARRAYGRRNVLCRLTAAVQLGVLEASIALEPDGRIEHVVFAGDFIANSPAIACLERRLPSCPLERSVIEPIVEAVFAERENFILGIGRTSAITDLLLRAVER